MLRLSKHVGKGLAKTYLKQHIWYTDMLFFMRIFYWSAHSTLTAYQYYYTKHSQYFCILQ